MPPGVALFFCVSHKHHSPWKTKAINSCRVSGAVGEARLRPSGLVFQPLDLAHGIVAADNYVVRIVYNAVNDSIG